MIILESIVNIYADSPFGEDRKISYHELQEELEALCKERCLFDIIRLGPGISHFMDDLAFYNIIEVEKTKGSQTKRDVKHCRFWLKVEFNELQSELQKLIN